MEYTYVPKVSFTPHNVGRFCTDGGRTGMARAGGFGGKAPGAAVAGDQAPRKQVCWERVWAITPPGLSNTGFE